MNTKSEMSENRELTTDELDFVSGGGTHNYYTQDEKGAKKDKVSGGWNIKQNAAAAA